RNRAPRHARRARNKRPADRAFPRRPHRRHLRGPHFRRHPRRPLRQTERDRGGRLRPGAHHRRGVFPLRGGRARHGRLALRRNLPARRSGHRQAGGSRARCRRAAFRASLRRPARRQTAAIAASPGTGQTSPLSRTAAEGTMNDDLGKRMSERMTKSEREQTSPDSEPRDAATLILIDRADATKPKVLLGRRHASHKFMPGKFVFPGGRIEAFDAKMTAVSELHPDMQKKLTARVANDSSDYARGFPLAAIRETAEETGLLLGVRRNEPPKVPGDIWAEFAEARVHPDLANIHFIARAITPPRRPRRFDTRFFTADA